MSALYSRSLGAWPDCAPAHEEIEAAIERWRLVVPCPLDRFDGEVGDVELCVAALVDDVLRGGEAHLLQLVARGFKGVDLGGGEAVGGGLVPVGRAIVERMKGEADGLDLLLPVFAWGDGDALHESPEVVVLPLLLACASAVAAAFTAAAVASTVGEDAAKASADGYAGAVGVAATGDWSIAATTHYAAEAIATPTTIVVAIGNEDGEEAAVAIGSLLLLYALLVSGKVGAELIVDDMVLFIDAALHLGFLAAGEHREGGCG